MSASYQQQNTSYSELMNCLLKERDRYATEDEFKAFALAEVRRFMMDLRSLEIEIAVRNQTGKLNNMFYSPKE
jgi:hypothetical protein